MMRPQAELSEAGGEATVRKNDRGGETGEERCTRGGREQNYAVHIISNNNKDAP